MVAERLSSSIETWEYVDDPRVIARINECDMMINFISRMQEQVDQEKKDFFKEHLRHVPDGNITPEVARNWMPRKNR